MVAPCFNFSNTLPVDNKPYTKNQPPLEIHRISNKVVWAEAEGQVMDATQTTELEIVWIAHGWLVLTFIPLFGSNLSQNHKVLPRGIPSTTCGRSTQALTPYLQPKKPLVVG